MALSQLLCVWQQIPKHPVFSFLNFLYQYQNSPAHIDGEINLCPLFCVGFIARHTQRAARTSPVL